MLVHSITYVAVVLILLRETNIQERFLCLNYIALDKVWLSGYHSLVGPHRTSSSPSQEKQGAKEIFKRPSKGGAVLPTHSPVHLYATQRS